MYTCRSCGSNEVSFWTSNVWWDNNNGRLIEILNLPFVQCKKCKRNQSVVLSKALVEAKYVDTVPKKFKQIDWEDFLEYALKVK